MQPASRVRSVLVPALTAAFALAAFVVPVGAQGLPDGPATEEQIRQGRHLVITHDCGACHGGGVDPSAEGWLAGEPEDAPESSFAGFEYRPANLTPDKETGLGGASARQIFNAIRYGLRTSTSPDVVITSHVAGEGNFPEEPDYLHPGMPWMYWRYLSDRELWAVVAYLKHGLKPVRHEVAASEAPEEGWADFYHTEMKVGGPELPPFPTGREAEPPAEKREQVLHGRALVARHACSGCHGGAVHPGQDGWLVGMTGPDQEFEMGGQLETGPFMTRPRNLTPHNTTGLGRFSERQIFNALRYGLRPGETPDLEITSQRPGEGNFPLSPKYLAPPMPWPAFRHLSDQELWDIAAYLKHGVKPVENRVADSEGPPDFWRSAYERFAGPYPAPDFPTARERDPGGS